MVREDSQRRKNCGDSQESAKTEASVQVLHLLHEGSKKANHHLEIRQKEQTVIAEFVCDKIRPIIGKTWIVKEDIERATSGSCLSLKQIIEYAGWSHCSSFTERKELYAWHISDLKIYDQPKSLSGFSRHDFRGMNGTDVCGNESCEHYQPSGSYMLPPTCAINGCCLSKPPQSWCYVAETEEDDAL